MMIDRLFCWFRRQEHLPAVLGLAAAVIVATVVSPPAVAAVLEDFNYGDGTLIHGQTPAGGEWFITSPGGAGVAGPKVFDDPGGDVAGRGQATLASQASDPDDAGVARLNLDNAISQDLTISFDYNTNTDLFRTLTLILGADPSAIGAEAIDGPFVIFGMPEGTGNGIRYRTAGAVSVNAPYDFPTNTWMEVVLNLQPSTKTYQMTIDGNTVFTDGSWNGYSIMSEVQVLAFERHGGIRTAYVDDLSVVAIPEPASVGLALLAVSLLTGRGWSRRRD